MKNLKVRNKIILPTGVLIVVLLVVTLVFTIVQYSNFAQDLIHQRIDSAANTMRDFTNDIRRQVIDVGLQVSYDQRLINAVLTGDTQEILRVSNEVAAYHGVTYITVAGADTIVLARTDEPDRFGDAFATASLLDALNGRISVAYSPVGLRRVPIRASVPLFHEGEIIGVAVVGYALDTPKAIENLQNRYDAEFTIFHETNGRHYRISSTLFDEQGNSVVGTVMTDPYILRTVFQQRQKYTGYVTVFGIEYIATYIPFYDSYGDALGVVFMAYPMAGINAQRTTVITMVVVIGVIGLAIALTVIYLISGSIVKPIKKLVSLVSDVSKGRLNVNADRASLSKDEVGGLTRDVYDLVDIIKEMTEDLVKVHHEYIKVGNIHYAIDESKYQNSYGEMIGLVNNLIAAVTVDILDVADVLGHISEGDFEKTMNEEVWVGDWIAVPNAVNKLTVNLKAVSSEIGALIDAAAVKGDLKFQISTENYNGDWREVMIGLNSIVTEVEKPIRVIELAILAMKEGNLNLNDIDAKIAAAGYATSPESYSGTFREIVAAFDSTLVALSSYIKHIGDDLAAISSGDLTTELEHGFVGDFAPIEKSLNDLSQTLHRTMTEISSASDQVLSGAKQISISAQELANGAQEQASSVEELNASIDIINQQTRQNADSAIEASEISNKSTIDAQEGNESMKEMVTAMSQIKESSGEISKIIKTISDIAFQTNLLALNASVEAARAGEHGKGFSVVADEVRNLAGRSQESATDTTGLIETSISRVESGSNIAEATSQSLDMIVKNAGEVSALISNISVASKEQAEAIAQISEGLSQISKVTQSNSAVSEQTAAASEELNSQADVLRQLVSFFKL